jgi:hypothetical protein
MLFYRDSKVYLRLFASLCRKESSRWPGKSKKQKIALTDYYQFNFMKKKQTPTARNKCLNERYTHDR